MPGDQTSFVDDQIKNGEIARYLVTSLVKVGDKMVESRVFSGKFLTVTGAPNPPVKIGDREFFSALLDGGGDKPATEAAGSATVDGNGLVTLGASGWGINGDFDGGQQLLTPVTGDFTFTARALGAPTADGGAAGDDAKFGVAVRESPLAESRYAGMLLTASRGIRSPHRRMFTAGELSEDLGPNEDAPTYPVYLRLQWRGDAIRMLTSADGTTFKPYGDPDTTILQGLVPNAYVGLIGTSGDNGKLAQARFDQVTLTTA